MFGSVEEIDRPDGHIEFPGSYPEAMSDWYCSIFTTFTDKIGDGSEAALPPSEIPNQVPHCSFPTLRPETCDPLAGYHLSSGFEANSEKLNGSSGYFDGVGISGEVGIGYAAPNSSSFSTKNNVEKNQQVEYSSTFFNNACKRCRNGKPKRFQSNRRNGSDFRLIHSSRSKSTPPLPPSDFDRGKHLEEGVAYQLRAKRGCATDPRSISERARRAQISQNLKKLQEHLPDVPEIINTEDLLESAAEYINELQREVYSLTEKKLQCMCLAENRFL